MKFKFALVFSAVLAIAGWQESRGQASDSTDLEIIHGMPVRPFHLGFVYPVSTNGVEAHKFVNRVSLHVLAGVDGGISGVAFSGLANASLKFTEGVQASGIANYSGGRTTGVQFAGIANASVGPMDGVQAAGIANVVADSSRAGQFAGITNISAGPQIGVQAAGIANITGASLDGSQFAGIANVVAGGARGGQFAGIANVSPITHTGAQVAGIANVADSITGAQLAAVVNVAGRVKGTQIALFNIADSVDGISIGFLSIIRHGYRRVEFSGSEALHAQFAFKIGMQKFYNIFSFGYHFSSADPWEYGETPTWGYGYGIGSELNLGHTWKMNMDLTTFDIIEKENTFEHKKLNLLNQFRLNFAAQLSNRFALVFGPSFNVMVSQLRGEDNGEIGSDLPPWTVYDKTHDGTNVKMWPGFNAAIRF